MSIQNDIMSVTNENDFSTFTYKFYEGKNFFPSIKENINNKLVEYVKNDDIENVKDFIKKRMKNEWDIPIGNFLTYEEQIKYNYNYDFFNVYAIYKYVKQNIINNSPNKEFYDLMGYICLNYFKNYSEFIKLKNLEEEFYNTLNFLKSPISNPETEDDFFIYLYTLKNVDLNTFMILKEKIENSDFENKDVLLTFLNDIYLDEKRREKYINKIISIYQIRYFTILNEFIFRNLNISETIINQYQNALFNERKRHLPKCEQPDVDTYGIFDGSKKYYYLYSRGEKILMDAGQYRYNYIVNKNYSEYCGYDAIIYELEEDILNIFPQVEVNLSSDEVFVIKLFNQFINREIFEVMCEFPTFRNLQKELKNTKDPTKENIVMLNQIIVDLLNLVCPIKNDNTIEYSILYNMLLKVRMALEKILSYNTLDNSLKTKLFLDKSERLFKIFYNDIQELLATKKATDLIEALVMLQEEKLKPLIEQIPIMVKINGYEFDLNHLKALANGDVKGVLFYNCFFEIDRLNDLIKEAESNNKDEVVILGKTFKVDTIKNYILDANRVEKYLVFLDGNVYPVTSLQRTIDQTNGDVTIIDGKEYKIDDLKKAIQIVTINLKNIGCFNFSYYLPKIEEALSRNQKIINGVKVPPTSIIIENGNVYNGNEYLDVLKQKLGLDKNADFSTLLNKIKNSDLPNKDELLKLTENIQNGGNLTLNGVDVSINDLLTSVISDGEINAAMATIGKGSQENLLGLVDYIKAIDEFRATYIGNIEDNPLHGINLSFLNKIGSLLKSVGEALKNLICQLMNILGKLLDTLMKFLGAIASLIAGVLEALGGFLLLLGGLLAMLVGCAFSLIISGIDLFMKLVESSKKAIDFIRGVGDEIDEFFNNTTSLIKKALKDITSANVEDTLEKILDKIKDVTDIDEIVAIVKEIVGKDDLSGITSKLRGIAFKELDNLKDVMLKEMANKMKNAVNVALIQAMEQGIQLTPEEMAKAQKALCDCVDNTNFLDTLAKDVKKFLNAVGQKNPCSISSLQDIIGESPAGVNVISQLFKNIDANTLLDC